jgi:chemosensory pili system protein ChpA (sensor histidine kinase/response regulator)
MKNRTVLIVDDESQIRLYLRKALELSGFNIIEAKDGVEALAIMQKTTPNFAIIDYIMPNMDGIELVQKMSQDPIMRKIPFMIVSSYDKQELIDRAFQIGAKFYMRKEDLTKMDIISVISAHTRGAL